MAVSSQIHSSSSFISHDVNELHTARTSTLRALLNESLNIVRHFLVDDVMVSFIGAYIPKRTFQYDVSWSTRVLVVCSADTKETARQPWAALLIEPSARTNKGGEFVV